MLTKVGSTDDDTYH